MTRTSFVGRERELAALRAALDATSLVTVVGAGGAGKTRLVREHLLRCDGVFCDASEASSVEALTIALSRALAVERVGELEAALREHGPTTIVIDNLEQLLPQAASAIDAWLRAAPDATFLLTSRTPTHLQGERLVEVAPLVPAAARALFTDRALALAPEVRLDDGLVDDIVERLDRLPLAIELAATQVRILEIGQIAAQLESKLDTFEARDPLQPMRHTTLRNTIAWSWRLLSERDRTAATQLSVFRGWFDLDAAAAVLDAPAMPIVHALRDHSLLTAEKGRYRLFEAVRDFARERLSSGDAAYERHDAYFEARSDPRNTDDLVDVHRRACAAPNPKRALRIVLTLEAVLLTRGPASLLVRLADEALAIAREEAPDVAAVHLARGHALADLGRFDESGAARQLALATARKTKDRLMEGRALASLGRHAWHRGALSDASRWTDEAIAIFRSLGEERLVAETCSHRANFRWLRGHVKEARRDYLEALDVLARHDDRRAQALALGNLASLERDMGLADDARVHFDRCLAMLEELDDRFHRGTFQVNLAGLLLEAGDVQGARAALDAALALHREANNRRWDGVTIALLAQCDEAEGDALRARAGFVAATELARRFGHPVMLALVLCWRARFAADAGDLQVARASVEEAEKIFATVGETVVSDILVAARAHVRLGEGDQGGAQRLADELSRSAALERSGDLRMAVARLDARLARPGSGLVVTDDGRRFRIADNPWQDISKRGALRRILDALATARSTAPGRTISREDLVAAGWPGERIHTEAAATRVYTAIATLRRLGLKSVLLRRDDGYLLDPDVPFSWDRRR